MRRTAFNDNLYDLIPPRSKLYSLPPIGVGTPHVESLSGYAARLAERHSTTLYHLFSKEVAPLINKPGTIGQRVSFASFGKAANGLGVIAADLVRVFETLTLRHDLRFTTMLPWADALSSKNLTREWRAWCPACYEECSAVGKELYDQLQWALKGIAGCVRHKRPLAQECPYCGQRQQILSHLLRPGFCARCRRWLGCRSSDEIQLEPLCRPKEEELRIAGEVGRLLAAAPMLPPSMKKLSFTENFRGYADGLFMGRGEPSRARLPADKQTIRCWLRGSQTPSLSLLVKTCLALNISSVHLLQGGTADGPAGDVNTPEQGRRTEGQQAAPGESLPAESPLRWKDIESVACVKKRLYAALDEQPPSSLTKLSKELGCTRGTLRKKFPELAARIAEKASAYYRPSADNERVLRVLKIALKEEPPPSLQEVSRLLGEGASATILNKKFPEESRKIVERYCAHKKRRFDNNALEGQLRTALERSPPPSMPKVSQELGISRATLYSKFPELIKAISRRFADYRRQADIRNREKARTEIRSICEKLLREGAYPYAAIVRAHLSVPCQSAAFSEIRREVISEWEIRLI